MVCRGARAVRVGWFEFDAWDRTISGGPLFDEVMATARISKDQPDYDRLRDGLHGFLSIVVRPEFRDEKIDQALLDALISGITDGLWKQLGEILHHRTFQRLERAWRGLWLCVDQVDAADGIHVHMLNVSKDDLGRDFARAPKVDQSGLYRLVDPEGRATLGTYPYAVICADFEFGVENRDDIALLQSCGAVAERALAPFIANAKPSCVSLGQWTDIRELTQLMAVMEHPRFDLWRMFRRTPQARFVGLVLPRVMLRAPYTDNHASFLYGHDEREDVTADHEHRLWGAASYAFATRIAGSFARDRWCANIAGVDDGVAACLGKATSPPAPYPVETQISERRDYELSQEGFISLALLVGADSPCFLTAASARKALLHRPDSSLTDVLNDHVSSQLPYLFIIARVAQYLRVLYRDRRHMFEDSGVTERALSEWLNHHSSGRDDTTLGTSSHPLRRAVVDVRPPYEAGGPIEVRLQLCPNFDVYGWAGGPHPISLELVALLD